MERMAIARLLASPKEPAPPAWPVESKSSAVADATPTRADALAMKKRLQYKLYQRRHRAKQREKSRLLEQHVAQLTQETEQLQRLMDRASTKCQPASVICQPSSECAITQPIELVKEYLRLFERGYVQDSSVQREFVRAMMEEDVRGPQIQGVDDLLSQWQLYSQVFASVQLTQRGVESELLGEVAVVQAKVTLTLQFHETSVSRLFPQLMDNDTAATELAGAALAVQGSLRFVFDLKRGRVSWLGPEMDFVAAFLEVSGSLSKLVPLTQGSRLDLSSGYVSPIDEPCRNQHQPLQADREKLN